MFSFTIYFNLAAIILGLMTVRADESALCQIWNGIEERLKHEAFQITCSKTNDCYGVNCSGAAHGYNVESKIHLHPCVNPPNVDFEVNIPKLNVNNIKRKIYHNDSVQLTKNLNVEFELERKDQKLILGLFVHFLNNGTFPLLHVPLRIPVISDLSFPVNCLISGDTQRQPATVKSISVVSLPPTKSFLVVSKSVGDGYSNCSIINTTCSEVEICQQISKLKPDGICICISNYTRNDDGKCVHEQKSDGSSVSLLLTAILVPIVVVLTLVAVVYASIRFRVFQNLRRRLRVQVYEHVLLGEDDDDDDEEEDLTNPVA